MILFMSSEGSSSAQPEHLLPVEIWQMVFREVRDAPVVWYFRSLVRMMTVCQSWMVRRIRTYTLAK
jgi:hypothetical protein